MITAELEQAILEAVQDIYRMIYIGKLKVDKLPNGFLLKMWFNKPELPIVIVYEGTSQEFLNFIRKEFKERHFNLVEYFTGYKYEPTDLCNQNINKSCSCNDK